MKTLRFRLFAIAVLAFMTLWTSCSKDENPTPENEISDNIVGSWEVADGLATVYDSGVKLADVKVTTEGTMTFNNDGKGIADFSLEVLDTKEVAKGGFTWEKDGFEIIVDKNTDNEERWSRIDDEKNRQILQYSKIDDEDPEVEVEFSLTLIRK